MSTLRRCIGSKRYGIEPHEAPIEDFPSQPSQKDGLGRMCKPHWNQYTRGLAVDARARRAAEAPTDADERKAAPSKGTVREKLAKPNKPARGAKAGMLVSGPAVDEPVVDGTARQAAEIAELESRLAAVGGPETDEGQALLSEAANRAAAARAPKGASRRTSRQVAEETPAVEEVPIPE